MSRTYVTNIGTPNQKDRKEYATPAGAKQWCGSRLNDFKEWAAKYNKALAIEITEAWKEINGLNLNSLPLGSDNAYFWRLIDEVTGTTLVVQIWVEEQ